VVERRYTVLGVAGPLPAVLKRDEGFEICSAKALTTRRKRTIQAFMANTAKLSRDERKKAKRTARKKRKAEKPLKPRDYARGSKKPKVKKLARGQAKR